MLKPRLLANVPSEVVAGFAYSTASECTWILNGFVLEQMVFFSDAVSITVAGPVFTHLKMKMMKK